MPRVPGGTAVYFYCYLIAFLFLFLFRALLVRPVVNLLGVMQSAPPQYCSILLPVFFFCN